MQYEIEKRSFLKTTEEYQRLKAYLDKKAKPLGSARLITYLFRKPSYLRIRFEENASFAILTHKSGGYTDLSRKETEVKIDYQELPNLFELLRELGFNRCVHIKAENLSYKLNELRVDLTTYEYLGKIVEFEGMTQNETEIPEIEEKIIKAMKDADLKELTADEYQKMLDKMYNEGEQDAIFQEK